MLNKIIESELKMTGRMIVDDKYCYGEEADLTVRKTSVFFAGDGFVVYDHSGGIVFRFDSYGPDPGSKNELVVMDGSGKCLLTLHRKKPSLHQRWEGYVGEKKKDGDQNPIFTVFKSSIIGRSTLMVEVYGDTSEEYHVEGSYAHRCCTIYSISTENSSKEPVAEIKRKVNPSTHVMLDKDVFCLCLKAGVDGAFVMGLILVLDHMYGDAAADDMRVIDPISQDSSS